jgi:hypothetical protein
MGLGSSLLFLNRHQLLAECKGYPTKHNNNNNNKKYIFPNKSLNRNPLADTQQSIKHERALNKSSQTTLFNSFM